MLVTPEDGENSTLSSGADSEYKRVTLNATPLQR